MNNICFSLNRVLSSQDIISKLMGLFSDGDKLFEVISRYSYLSDTETEQDHLNKDIVTLIAPFLAYHGITENDIYSLARKAAITDGTSELISRLNSRAWSVYCITSSYKQYAVHLTQRLSIFSQNVACTYFPLDELSAELNKDDFHYVKTLESQILDHYPVDDNWIKKNIAAFYRKILPGTSFASLLEQIEPMDSEHKIKALEHFSELSGQALSDWIAIGSSSTDFKMLETVDKVGGLAVAFNAQESTLSHATLGLASTNLDDLWPVIELWGKGKLTAVDNYVKKLEQNKSKNDSGTFHWLMGRTDLAPVTELHAKIRNSL